MDIKKPLFITILIVAFCIAGIVYIRMTKKPVPAPAPAEIAVKKKENKPAQEVKKELPAIKEEQPENKYLPLKTASGDISAYLDLNFNREPYKTVCLGYEGQTCTSNASLYASGNGKAVLYKVCSGTENGVPENCSKNILAVYNDKEKITDLYICNPKALFGQCGNWQERKHFTYDKLGNIVREEVFTPQGSEQNLIAEYNFAYDSLGRQIYSKECLSFQNNSCIRWDLPVPASAYPPYLFVSFYKPYIDNDKNLALPDNQMPDLIFDKRNNFVAFISRNYPQELEKITFNNGDNIMERYCISKEDETCIYSGDLVLDEMGRAVNYRICKHTQPDVCQVEKIRKIFYDNYGRPSLVFNCTDKQSSDGCKTGKALAFFYKDNNTSDGKYMITKQIYCTDFDLSGRCLKYDTGWIKPKGTWLYCYAFDAGGNCLNAQQRDTSFTPHYPAVVAGQDEWLKPVLINAQYNEDKTKIVFCKDRISGICEYTGEGLELVKDDKGGIEVALKYKQDSTVKMPYAYFIDDGKGNYIDVFVSARNGK